MSKEKTAFIPKQYFAVVAVLLAIMMSVLDGTIMNIALPTLAHDFDVTPSNAIWIVNAYQLVITMTLLSFASLGDIYGYRRIFLTGISIFAGASLACALSDSFWMLTVSRIIQGFGAACVMSVNTALIRLIYPPQILGRGMGVNAMVVAVSAAAGPSIAGSILALGSWHWLFVINIPLGLAALVIGHRFLPHNPASDTKHKFDKISAIANALTFGLLIYTLEGFAHAENRKFIAIQLVLLIIIGTYFIRRQLKKTTPILPVDLLKIPIFALSIGTSITSFTAQMLAMVSLPFFMQNILGYSAVQIGLLLTPWPLATILTAPLAGRLVEKVHPGLLGGIGMAIFATGLFTLDISLLRKSTYSSRFSTSLNFFSSQCSNTSKESCTFSFAIAVILESSFRIPSMHITEIMVVSVCTFFGSKRYFTNMPFLGCASSLRSRSIREAAFGRKLPIGSKSSVVTILNNV